MTNSDIHSFGRSGDGTQSPHLSHNLSLNSSEAGNMLTIAFEGTREELFEKLKGSEFFKQWSGDGADAFPEGGSNTSGAGFSYPYLARVNIRRTRGPTCEAQFMINQVRVVGIWGLDFAEISKPIMAWYRPGTPPSDTSEDNRPSGQKIRAWKKLGDDNPASPDYNNFIVDGSELTGATRTLAEMIYRGIESFSVYVPVVTWQCRCFDTPDVNLYLPGIQMDELAAPSGIQEIGDKDFLSNLNNLASPWTMEPYIWVRSSSKVQTLPDATYMWSMQFLACESADSDLYPQGS